MSIDLVLKELRAQRPWQVRLAFGTQPLSSKVGGPSGRGARGHINTRIPHSGPKAQYKGDTRNHVLVGALCLCGLGWGLVFGTVTSQEAMSELLAPSSSPRRGLPEDWVSHRAQY